MGYGRQRRLKLGSIHVPHDVCHEVLNVAVYVNRAEQKGGQALRRDKQEETPDYALGGAGESATGRAGAEVGLP